MGKAIVRLKDIADKTGFSTNTVSLALRESPRIPLQTRELIRRAATELNYLPNQIAKSLVSRETKTIGLVLTDITNPTLTHTAQAIEIALAERGYGTLFATSNNTLREEIRAIEMVRARQVDGILIYPTSHRQLDHLRPLRRANYPIVLLVGDPDAGIDIDRDHWVDPHGHSVERGYWAVDALMNGGSRPTAIFAANDSLALGALRWCLKHKLRVPEDLAIVGMDNIEYAEYASVPLSSVNYAVETVTRMAVDRLMRLISAGDQLPEPRVTQIDPDLVTRESTLGQR